MDFKPNYTHCSTLFLLKCFIFSFFNLKCFCYSVGFRLAPNVFGAQRPNRRAQRKGAERLFHFVKLAAPNVLSPSKKRQKEGFKPNYTHCSAQFLFKCFIFSFCSLKCFCYSVGAMWWGLDMSQMCLARSAQIAERSEAAEGRRAPVPRAQERKAPVP